MTDPAKRERVSFVHIILQLQQFSALPPGRRNRRSEPGNGPDHADRMHAVVRSARASLRDAGPSQASAQPAQAVASVQIPEKRSLRLPFVDLREKHD
jgi:hypothetical protein